MPDPSGSRRTSSSRTCPGRIGCSPCTGRTPRRWSRTPSRSWSSRTRRWSRSIRPGSSPTCTCRRTAPRCMPARSCTPGTTRRPRRSSSRTPRCGTGRRFRSIRWRTSSRCRGPSSRPGRRRSRSRSRRRLSVAPVSVVCRTSAAPFRSALRRDPRGVVAAVVRGGYVADPPEGAARRQARGEPEDRARAGASVCETHQNTPPRSNPPLPGPTLGVNRSDALGVVSVAACGAVNQSTAPAASATPPAAKAIVEIVAWVEAVS